MNRFLSIFGCVVAMFAMTVSNADAQCRGNSQIDQTNLLLGQQLSAFSAQSGQQLACNDCQKQTRSFSAAPAQTAPPLQMFTLPTPPQKQYIVVEQPQQQPNVLYMASAAPAGGASSSASASAGAASSSASTSANEAFSLPLISQVVPAQAITQNSTACGGGSCGRGGLLRRAFSGFGSRRQTTRSVSRSFSSTTVN